MSTGRSSHGRNTRNWADEKKDGGLSVRYRRTDRLSIGPEYRLSWVGSTSGQLTDTMRVGVHGRELAGGGGTHTYVKNLLRNIPKVTDGLELVVCAPASAHCPSDERISLETYRVANSLLADHCIAPWLLGRQKPDVAWFPKNVVPYWYPGTSVVTIHDMGYFVDPDFYSFGDRVYMKRMIESACERADEVIAVSNNTRDDVLRYTNADPDDVHVVYHGVAEHFREMHSEREKRAFRKKHGLPGPDTHILYGGNTGRRKNLAATIDAVSRVTDWPTTLVITGGSPSKQVRKRVQTRSDVVHLGHLPADELPLLYQTASALLYVSRYEGFGLPVLEAMASRTPVVTSRTSSLPEVAGDAAILVDPERTDQIAAAVRRVLDWSPAERARHIEDGVARASEFTWERTARKTTRVFEDAVR